MARDDVTVTTAPGAYAGSSTAVTMTAADTSNKEQFTVTGRELLIIQNTAGSAGTWTLTSTDDPYGRQEHISTESIAAGAIHVYGPTALEGWQQSDGKLYFEGSASTIKFGVIRLP